MSSSHLRRRRDSTEHAVELSRVGVVDVNWPLDNSFPDKTPCDKKPQSTKTTDKVKQLGPSKLSTVQT